MAILNETSLEYWCKTGVAFVSITGYSMARELAYSYKPTAKVGPWVLRGPNGEFVDRDYMRTLLMERNGFAFQESDER